MKVYIIGAGTGADDFLTARAKKAADESEKILTTGRLSEYLTLDAEKVQVCGISEICGFICEHSGADMTVSVLASGDTGFYSIASTILKQVPPEAEIQLISGISSLQYFCAALKTGYEDVKLISAHGRECNVVSHVCYNRRVFTLTGGKIKAHDIIDRLCEAGLGGVKVSVGENLSLPQERIITSSAEKLRGEKFDNLSVMLIENNASVNHWEMLHDSDFIRGDTPMTKESVRNLSVDFMNISPSDVVYDIGAGTGSVSVCMARKAYESVVYAVEKEADAVELIRKNAVKLGAYNIEVISGTAPQAITELPPPDKVFIGGSSGELKEILAAVLDKNSNAEIVLNAVTLETVEEAPKLFESMGLETAVTCINVSNSRKLGRYHLMTAENPVYIIRGKRREKD